MKRISLYVLSVVFLAVGMASCGKTTKGKLVNDWKVTAHKDVSTYINSTNDKSTTTISLTETVYTETEFDEPASGSSSTSTKTGTVNKNEFTIKKDGTWTWITDVTFTDGTETQNQYVEQSGTWSFVEKTKGDDFKKNERVLFNILKQIGKETTTDNQQVIDSTTDDVTYSTGRYVMIYTIAESKKDKLELELESKMVYDNGSNTVSNSSSNSSKLTLEKK